MSGTLQGNIDLHLLPWTAVSSVHPSSLWLDVPAGKVNIVSGNGLGNLLWEAGLRLGRDLQVARSLIIYLLMVQWLSQSDLLFLLTKRG